MYLYFSVKPNIVGEKMKKILLVFVCALMILGCKKQEADNVEAVSVQADEKSESVLSDSVINETPPIEETEDLGESCFYLTAHFIGLYKIIS